LLYRHQIVTPRRAGTLSLPGDMARLREYTDRLTGAEMTHDPTTNTLTVVLSVTHPTFVLLGASEQHHRVTTWTRAHTTSCRSDRVAALQVLKHKLPDSRQGLAAWRAEHGAQGGSWETTPLQRTNRLRKTR